MFTPTDHFLVSIDRESGRAELKRVVTPNDGFGHTIYATEPARQTAMCVLDIALRDLTGYYDA